MTDELMSSFIIFSLFYARIANQYFIVYFYTYDNILLLSFIIITVFKTTDQLVVHFIAAISMQTGNPELARYALQYVASLARCFIPGVRQRIRFSGKHRTWRW